MDFHIDRLSLENFRCFKADRLELGRDLTVLIADNGHGKSAALDAIAICLAQLIGPAQLRPRRPVSERLDLQPSDASTIDALPPYIDSEFPAMLTMQAFVDNEEAAWNGVLMSESEAPSWQIPAAASGAASSRTRKLGSSVTLPVFAYYGTNRASADVVQLNAPNLGQFDRGFGYQNALQAGGSLDELGPWLAQSEWERSGRGASLWESALDAVYEASAEVLRSHGVTRVSYSMEDRDLVLDFGRLVDDEATGTVSAGKPGNSIIPMRLAADGYRSILGMVSDLAFRCGVLNSHLGGEAPQLTSGVVLIDEIDMHLHPTWQTHVLDDLARAFPRIQFVVTTHSPFILSSVANGCVRRIVRHEGRSTFETPTSATEGVRIELLTEALLASPVRAGGEFSDRLAELAEALERKDLETAGTVVEQIDSDRHSDPDLQRLLAELRWRQQRAER